MLILLAALTQAEAAPAYYSDCRTTYAGSDACACLRASSTGYDWWAGVESNLGNGASPTQAPAWSRGFDTCYDMDAVLAAGGASASMYKQLVSKGTKQSEGVTKNIVTGAGGGYYRWDLGTPESIVWETLSEPIFDPDYPNFGLPVPFDPWAWDVFNGYGEYVTTVYGDPANGGLTEVIGGDWNDDGIPDMALVWESGEIWDAFGPFSPEDPVTPPI